MPTRKKILVVEDNEINRAMLNGILSSDYEVLEAENGAVALNVLASLGEEISLILLDIVMPVMDGYTFLSHVKADARFASIPVIVTTQSDGESDEVTALSHGATDFVAKPYKPQVILHRVASIINLRETAAMINLIQYDRLTGLYSKEFFYQRVKEILLRHPERKYDILCSDIENFKFINDVFGISAGDKLLCGVAELYRKWVGDRGITGRFNADQFACLVERGGADTYTDEGFLLANKQVNALFNAKSVVMKWGIYSVEDDGISVEQMCDRAILAACSIKGQYGKYFARYDDELRSKLLREQAITDSMETALREGQFLIYLQPKYEIASDRLAGAEALVRWDHPEWGFQMPGEFIPLFEKNGFITQLDQFVWDRACAAVRSWDDRGLPPICISVNVSRADIYNANLTEILMSTLRKYGLSPDRLHLEITESAYTEDPQQIIDTVSRLRELGFAIEMDDFGSGYSSLNMISQMPFDILKLDMRFIQTEMAKPADEGILRFIMGLARWMNLKVVAEGVETREQLERLRRIGCDYAQGYYYAKPISCEEFETLLRTQQADMQDAAREAARSGGQDERQILLLADEDAQYRREMAGAFQDEYEVVEADCADAALAALSGSEHRIAAAVVSLTLSKPDGFSVLEVLQRELAVWNIPTIATAAQAPELEERALMLGANFAGKPHTPQSLRIRLLRAMEYNAFCMRACTLQNEAHRDALTGLLNRRGLNVAAEELRKEEGPFAVYLFDLDDLKRINDTYGHGAGDRILERFSAVLRSHIRETDLISRYGGDEFVAVIKRMPSEEEAARKGEEICTAFRQAHGEEIPAACTAGVAFSAGELVLPDLIARADRGLYRAKADNKGGCRLQKG